MIHSDNDDSPLATLELFFGDANDAIARVYARVAITPGQRAENITLSGMVSGPECAFATTLPARVPLLSKGPGVSLLAEAVVPDPCFWTTELPFLYRVRVELRNGNEVLAAREQMFGIRRLGVSGRKLYFDTKRYIVRAVSLENTLERDWLAWRAADAAMLVQNPNDDFCRRASEQGVLLLAMISSKSRPIEGDIRRLARWPAVGIAILETPPSSAKTYRAAAGNLLLAELQSAGSTMQMNPSKADWADVVVTKITANATHSSQISSADFPELIVRQKAAFESLAVARSACDQLQRELARLGDFAGYGV